MSSGQITRKEIITDEAIGWGKEYANVVNEAIAVNNTFIQSIVTLNAENIKLRKSENQVEYLKQKNELKLATDKVNLSIDEQKKLELSLEKIRQEKIKTEKLELDVLNKKQAAQNRGNKLSIEEKLLLQEQTAETKRQVIANGALGNAYRELSAKVTIAGNALKNIVATGKLASESQAQYNKRLQEAQSQYDKLNARVRSADAAVGTFNRNVGNYPTQAVAGLKNLISAFGVTTGIYLFASVIKDIAKTIIQFEEEIVNLAAIAGKSRKEIAPLEAEIRNVAKSSINSATEVAKLTTALIKLGATPEEAIKLLKPVNDLSIALRSDAEASAELVKGILNAYGEDATQASRVTDVLAASANKSALSFDGLRDSFGYVAPAARALGYTIEETAAFVSILVDNNIKAESAGRLLSTSFTRLATQGLTLESALDKINKAQKDGASTLEVLALAGKIFGAESAKIGLILANNRDRMSELTDEYNRSAGSLKELTEKQLKSASAQIKIMTSTWEEFILSIDSGDGPISKTFGKLIEWTTGAINGLRRLNQSKDDLRQEVLTGVYQQTLDKEVASYQKMSELAKKMVSQTTLDKATAELKVYEDQVKTLEAKNKAIKASEISTPLGNVIPDNGINKIKANNAEIENATNFITVYKAKIEAAQSVQNSLKAVAVENDKESKKLTEEELKRQKEAAERYKQAELKRLKSLYELQQKANNDAFNLSQFRLQNEIDFNDAIIENDKSSTDERLDALDESNALLLAKNKQAIEYQLQQLGKYNEETGKFVRELSNIEITELINTGKTKKSLTDEQKLIFEKYQQGVTNVLDIEAKKRQTIIDAEVATIQKSIDAQLQLQENSLNKDLVSENDRYSLELDAAGNNFKLIEKARIDHEKRILDIQREYALLGLDLQIGKTQKILDDQKKLPENQRISSDLIKGYEADLARFQIEKSNLTTGVKIENSEKLTQILEDNDARIKQLATDLANSLESLAYAVFDAKIANIDNEMAYWDEYYNNQLELAGDDAAQKEAIQAEAKKKKDALEKERRKEEYKAAVVSKIMAAAQIAVDLARTLSAINLAARMIDTITFGLGGLPYQGLQVGLAIGTAAAQAAAVALTPLPKYEKGTQGKPHKGGPALLGEKRPEVVIEPGKAPYIVDVPSVMNLAKGTEVIPSIDEYEKIKRASIMASIQMEGRKMSQVTSNKSFDNAYSREMLNELRQTRKSILNQKQPINNIKVDIGYEIWKMGNTKWN
ncbi:phage tail tape measure protein [uncultured Flavobacterium sp.]|uniref:phage tail tape measure protein n=1 Tax=uncultured Flavobacterium sp. TaxID=165435 RepID=UPI0030EBECDD|tara:strand:+ start:38081 stop:41803 length:3723 start_codon:yes stop_codon:yes gene_type:complete